jgi:hypothetical protein
MNHEDTKTPSTQIYSGFFVVLCAFVSLWLTSVRARRFAVIS